jgi:hypothetical protein
MSLLHVACTNDVHDIPVIKTVLRNKFFIVFIKYSPLSSEALCEPGMDSNLKNIFCFYSYMFISLFTVPEEERVAKRGKYKRNSSRSRAAFVCPEGTLAP